MESSCRCQCTCIFIYMPNVHMLCGSPIHGYQYIFVCCVCMHCCVQHKHEDPWSFECVAHIYTVNTFSMSFRRFVVAIINNIKIRPTTFIRWRSRHQFCEAKILGKIIISLDCSKLSMELNSWAIMMYVEFLDLFCRKKRIRSFLFWVLCERRDAWYVVTWLTGCW